MSLLRGRFDRPASERMARFSSSLASDRRMLDEDVDGSLAHVAVLAEAGLISGEEAEVLREGLARVREEIRSGAWVPGDEHEDIHMAVEARLTELVGEAGGKLHTARSRNDQVATDVRLWLKRRLGAIDEALAGLLAALLGRIESEGRTLLPGYTHLQRGQPVWLGHHLLAHAWALSRDRERLAAARTRLDRCPLGAAALAGTPHPVNRELSARLLGFAAPVENAMDAVAGRDHEQEAAAACAIAMGHLSRMAEELVLWSSSEFAFVRLPEEFVTGSSIMPQKRNPDAAELVRGKAARVHGALQTLLGLTRSLPLAYNRDLQESREPLFDSVEATRDSLAVMAGLWEGLEIDRERFAAELKGDLSLATELADHLAARGVPFREAHAIVGRAVRWCEERGGGLELLGPESAAGFHELLAGGLEDLLDPAEAAERRRSLGGTAWREVERQVGLLRETLASP